MRASKAALIALVFGRVAVACDPETIAPLPSPIDPPDERRIVTSSLIADTADEGLVAVVGFDGAVSGKGSVKILNTRTGDALAFVTTEAGTFTATLLAQAGDPLEVSHVAEDGRESEVIAIAVPTATAVPAGQPTGAPEPDAGETPAPPAHGEFGANDSDGKRVQTLPVIVSLGDGTVHITAGPGFIDPLHFLVVANLTRSEVHETLSDGQGGIDFVFPGSPGDEIAFFARSPADPQLTSPVKKTAIPGP